MPLASQPNAISSSIGWILGTLTGSVATALATIAFAALGLLLMSGRIDVRRAATVAFACFLIFGAPALAQGIMKGLGQEPDGAHGESLPSAPPPPLATDIRPASPYDPYAGAAVPRSR